MWACNTLPFLLNEAVRFDIFNVVILALLASGSPGIIEGAKDGKGRGRQVIAGNYERIVHPKIKISSPQTIQDADFVS